MKFYFCERCGTRITDEDIEAGQGKNKKLKGVYCKTCGEGVMTVEMMAVTEEEINRYKAMSKLADDLPKKVSPVAISKRKRSSRVNPPPRDTGAPHREIKFPISNASKTANDVERDLKRVTQKRTPKPK